MAGVALNGVLFFLFLAAAPIAFGLNLLVQWRYRTAIKAAMLAHSPRGQDDFLVPAPDVSETRALVFESETVLEKSPIRWAMAVRYLVAGLAFGAVAMTVMFALEQIEFGPRRSTIVALVLATPAVPFCIHVAGFGRLAVFAGTAIWIAVLYLIESATPLLIAIEVGPAGLAALILANRLFRTTALTLYLIALMMISPLLFALDLALLLVPTFVYAALPVAVVILFGVGLVLSWIMTRYIARLSAAFSDLMLQGFAIWFMMTLWQISLLSSAQGVAAFWSATALMAYVATLYVLSKLRRRTPAPLTLFLRVFGQRSLQQKFTAGPMTDWRMKGPIMLIGAADLATETLDNEELFAFLNGATQDLFIGSYDDYQRAMQRSVQRAHDGLYPVLDYYCQDDTWRLTVQAMMSRADRVVLDLRGFTQKNLGVQFEIGELVRRVAVERIIVLFDETTDTALAQDLFLTAWSDTHGKTGRGVAQLRFVSGDRG